MDSIIQFDQELFYLINHEWNSDILDLIMPIWRNKIVWIPFYAFIGSFMWVNFKKAGLVFIVLLAITVGISDTLSSKIIKKSVQRERPCNTAGVNDDIHMMIDCSTSYSFTSSHATNHFAVASFIIFTLGGLLKYIRFPLFLWAALVCYAQVYVGAHFPLDVLAGAILGCIIGWLGAQVFNGNQTLQLTVDSR